MSSLKPRLTFANVISMIALFVALGGSAYAVKIKLKTNQVKSKHIAPDAATGADVNEGSLGTVPSATNATTAQNATTASNVGGFTEEDFVKSLGDGVQAGLARTLDDGGFRGLNTGEGILRVDCSATPDLSWRDDVDDGDSDPPTDIWHEGGGHIAVADGAANTSIDTDMSNESKGVTVWTGGDTIWDFQVSVAWDAGATECNMVIFANAEVNLPPS